MKQTAVEWLKERINIGLTYEQEVLFEGLFEQAKEIEKEHLCEMYIQGRNDYHLDYYPEKHAKETYDEMFKK
jgi:hypothetical protein